MLFDERKIKYYVENNGLAWKSNYDDTCLKLPVIIYNIDTNTLDAGSSFGKDRFKYQLKESDRQQIKNAILAKFESDSMDSLNAQNTYPINNYTQINNTLNNQQKSEPLISQKIIENLNGVYDYVETSPEEFRRLEELDEEDERREKQYREKYGYNDTYQNEDDKVRSIIAKRGELYFGLDGTLRFYDCLPFTKLNLTTQELNNIKVQVIKAGIDMEKENIIIENRPSNAEIDELAPLKVTDIQMMAIRPYTDRLKDYLNNINSVSNRLDSPISHNDNIESIKYHLTSRPTYKSNLSTQNNYYKRPVTNTNTYSNYRNNYNRNISNTSTYNKPATNRTISNRSTTTSTNSKAMINELLEEMQKIHDETMEKIRQIYSKMPNNSRSR